MSWHDDGTGYGSRTTRLRAAEGVAQSMQGLGFHSPQGSTEYWSAHQQSHSSHPPPPPPGPLPSTFPSPCFPPSSASSSGQHSPNVQSYRPPPPQSSQSSMARNRQPAYGSSTGPANIQFSPGGDGTYLPSPLESPSFRVGPPFVGHSPNLQIDNARAGTMTPSMSYDGAPGGEGGNEYDTMYPFNSRPPDMSTSVSSAWSYPLTTPPGSSTASSFRRGGVSRSTSPSAASVMSAYSSISSSASAPQGYQSLSSTRAARSSPYHFRNRASASTPSLSSSAGHSPSTSTSVSQPKSGLTPKKHPGSKASISGDRSAAQRNKAKLTDEQKKEICVLKRENSQLKQDDLAARFGVERSTVSKILKDAARWMNPAAWVPEKRKESIAPTSVPITRFVELEGPLTVWLRAQAAQGDKNPSDHSIKEKALEIAGQLSWPSDKFKASSGWLDGFKARHDLFKHSLPTSKAGSNSGSDSLSRRASPVKMSMEPMQLVVSSAPASSSTVEHSPNGQGTPVLKEGFEYTARKRSSSSVSLRSFPNLPTVLEDSHLIAQPHPRRTGQLGRSESLAILSSMENVSLTVPHASGGSVGRPALSPLTPSSGGGLRPVPQRSVTYPSVVPGSTVGPVTPVSLEGNFEASGVVYLQNSPSDPPPPVGPFEARRHHRRLHSQSNSSLGSGSMMANYEKGNGEGVGGWGSAYPSPQDQPQTWYGQSSSTNYQPQYNFQAEEPSQDTFPAVPLDGFAYATVHYSPDQPQVDQFGQYVNPQELDGELMLSAKPDGQHPSVSPGHSAVPSRLASPSNSPTTGGGGGGLYTFPKTRSYTNSQLAQTSNFSSPPAAHNEVSYLFDNNVGGYEPVDEQHQQHVFWGYEA